MVKVSCTEGWISIGPWGGREGKGWAYKPTEGFIIKQIIIRHGGAVDSIVFPVCIGPAEQITSINITIAHSMSFGNFSGQHVITSLSFVTNVTEYGPFGTKTGTFISTLVENGCVVGFHGRAGEFINSIGFYTYPKFPCICQIPVQEQQSIKGMDLLSLRDPGPWGGPGGNQWDDGVFAAVQKVHLYVGHDSIHAIQLEYMKRDGKTIQSPMRGTPCGELIEMDFAAEVLEGIEGYCGPVEEEDGIAVAITSISLYTNRGKYGPFGEGDSNEKGRSYFVSGLSGKVVGFFGRSGTCLNALGIHVEYTECL